MEIFDTVNNEYVEVDGTQGLLDLIDNGRQIDLYLKETKIDDDGYMMWDVEHWSQLSESRYVRCYSRNGKFINRESTRFAKGDILMYFRPDDAEKIEIS